MRAYSQRLSWTLASNSLSRLIQEKRHRGVPLLDLTISNPTEAFAEYPHEAIRGAYARMTDFTYSPTPLGQERARRAISELYAQRGVSITPERVILTASSSEAYALLFKLFCDAEDEILAPVPSYPLFEFLARLELARIVPYRLRYDGAWFIDFRSLRERISRRTRAIVIVNPNNPTGSFLKRHERDELFELARHYELPIISDEVFMDYSWAATTEQVKTLAAFDSVLSFSLNGLSKTAGMPQMKLGWMVINGAGAEREMLRERLEILLDTYLSVSTPVQNALPDLIEIGAGIQDQIARRIRENRAVLDRVLEGSPAHRLNMEGGWSAIIRLPHTSSEEEWVGRLIEEGVIVQPGYFFDMDSEPYAVISLITPLEIFEQGISRLRALASCSHS